MAKEKKEKVSITKYDPVEDPEDIIAADKNIERKEAFRKTYKVIAGIVPNYFMEHRGKRNNNNNSGGGNAFSQSIIVTTEEVTVQTEEVKAGDNKEVKEERERED